MPQPSYELTRCPVCGSADGDELADAEALKKEVELLWEFHGRRLRAGVPAERLTDRLAFSLPPPLRLMECARCTHIYRNPWERREALRSTFDDGDPGEGVLEALFITQRNAYQAQARRLTQVLGRAGRGLEVGSYVGGFLAAARDAGWTFEGIDVSASAAAFATRLGYVVRRGEISDLPAERPYDVVAIWNTFEQLYDAREAVEAARRLLTDSGILAVRVPNGAYYAGWRKRLRGPLRAMAVRLLAHNNLLSFPYRQGFTRESVTRLFHDLGLHIVMVFGDTLVPIADRWTTRWGTIEERVVKRVQQSLHRGWGAPWVEVYARAKGSTRHS